MEIEKLMRELSDKFHVEKFMYKSPTENWSRVARHVARLILTARINENKKYLTYLHTPENLAGFLVRQQEAKKLDKLTELRIEELRNQLKELNEKG